MGILEKYELVIWDVDGTILDTAPGLISSTEFMIKELALPPIGIDTLQSFVGPRIQDSLVRVYGLEGDRLSEAASTFREHYKISDVYEAIPYEGIYEVMDSLAKAGIKQAVATNKRQDFVDSLMDKFGFSKYFSSVHGTDFGGKLVKADLVRMCLKDAGVSPDKAVMVGDSEYDFEAALSAGTDFVGVTYGFGYKKGSSADNCKMVDSVSELMN